MSLSNVHQTNRTNTESVSRNLFSVFCTRARVKLNTCKLFVKLCVHFVSMYVSNCSQKWTQTDTKVTFHPTHSTHLKTFFSPIWKLWLKIKLFYSISIALTLPIIKDIVNFVFKVVNKEAQILSQGFLSIVCLSLLFSFSFTQILF